MSMSRNIPPSQAATKLHHSPKTSSGPSPISPERPQARRLSASPNPDRSLALYTPHKHSRHSRVLNAEVRVLNLKSGHSHTFSNHLRDREPSWLGEGNQVIWLRDTDDGATELWVSDVAGSDKNCYCAGRISSRVSNLKLHKANECTIALAFKCPTRPDGSLFSESAGSFSHVSNSIWYTCLSKRANENNAFNLQYIVSPGKPINALKATGLTSPASPHGGHDFDIASTGITFVARDSSIGAADPLKTDLYYIPVKDFSSAPPPKPQILDIPGFKGSSTHPVFSPNGKSIAFLKKEARRDENDRNRLIVVNDLDKPMPATGEMPQKSSREGWHLSPQSVSWSDDGTDLYVIAEEHGHRKLFKVPYLLSSIASLPKPVANECSVFGIQGFKSSVSRIITLSPSIS
ncbi:MAG: hypothetical protein Q9191_006355 [Dirinaria sp. TL-2023a]